MAQEQKQPRKSSETEEAVEATPETGVAERKEALDDDDLFELHREARALDLDVLVEVHDEHELERALDAARQAYAGAARELTATRTAAAQRLDAAVAAELAPLKLHAARFRTALAAADPGPAGSDRVEFEIATNPGAPFGPLIRIASGGELSRFILALKVALAEEGGASTMIFDEIDRGVGGATAAAVGRRLADLAHGGQVLVVTHSPQVAALGAHHWRVEKQVANGMTTSRVVPLGQTERVDEIARMLAGETVTDAARGAARELLGAAGAA